MHGCTLRILLDSSSISWLHSFKIGIALDLKVRLFDDVRPYNSFSSVPQCLIATENMWDRFLLHICLIFRSTQSHQSNYWPVGLFFANKSAGLTKIFCLNLRFDIKFLLLRSKVFLNLSAGIFKISNISIIGIDIPLFLLLYFPVIIFSLINSSLTVSHSQFWGRREYILYDKWPSFNCALILKF